MKVELTKMEIMTLKALLQNDIKSYEQEAERMEKKQRMSVQDLSSYAYAKDFIRADKVILNKLSEV